MTGIIQLIFDDLGFGDFGCYGHPDLATPNIDSIAANGTKYDKMLVTPVCSTTRACLMTGLPPQYLGMHAVDAPYSGNRNWISPETPTVASRLKELGWATGHFGKAHWGRPPHTLLPHKFGYDRFFGYTATPQGTPPSFNVSQDTWFLREDETLEYREGYVTDVELGVCLDWIIEKVDAGENYYAEPWTHTPHEPESFDVPELADYPTGTYTERQRYYYAVIAHVDAWVGQLLAALSSRGVLDDTLIVVGSENGPEPHFAKYPHSAGRTAPYRGWKTSLWMGGICVPWVMRGPGVASGATDTRFRAAEDWMATCLALAGYDTSHIPGGLIGYDMRSTPPDRYICREFHGPKRSGTTPAITANESTCVKADATSRWKLFRNDVSGDRLFDINADPGEETDVSGSNAATLSELQGELSAWLATWADEVPANHSFPAEDPSTVEDVAGTSYEEPGVHTWLIRCVDAADQTSKVALIEKALGIPHTTTCNHGFSGVTISELGGEEAAHPTMVDYSVIRVGREVIDAADDATAMARLTASEQTDYLQMVREAAAPSVP